MSRLTAALATDVRLQWRNGFYAATLLIVVCSTLLLRWLPTDTARLILPLAILTNVVMNTFYFVSGLLLLERVEGTLIAQRVTPLRPGEYLASKVVTLTVLSMAESLFIAAAVFGIGTWLVTMAMGIGLSAILFCLAGVAVVTRYDSVNEFLLPSVVYVFLLTLPLLGILGLGSTVWYLPHPAQAALALMQMNGPDTASRWIYAVGYPLLWIGPAYVWSRRALLRITRT
jgi:fluoroquinolone transport system permease protein